MTSYAKRCPKLKKSGDAQKDARSEIEYAAVQQAISILQSNPHLALETVGMMQKKLQNMSAETSNDGAEARFTERECSTIARLPEEWFAQWLKSITNGALADDLMKKVLRADPTALLRLKTFSLQMAESVVLPHQCAIKKICARVLNDRHTTVGAPLSHDWITKNIAVSGNINWKSGGCMLCALCVCVL